jgi:hypothetical protein
MRFLSFGQNSRFKGFEKVGPVREFFYVCLLLSEDGLFGVLFKA